MGGIRFPPFRLFLERTFRRLLSYRQVPPSLPESYQRNLSAACPGQLRADIVSDAALVPAARCHQWVGSCNLLVQADAQARPGRERHARAGPARLLRTEIEEALPATEQCRP